MGLDFITITPNEVCSIKPPLVYNIHKGLQVLSVVRHGPLRTQRLASLQSKLLCQLRIHPLSYISKAFQVINLFLLLSNFSSSFPSA